MPAITFPSALPKNSLQTLFPPSFIRAISTALNASIVILLTKLIWTPRPLCTPAQDRQIKTPNFGDAHCGLGAPQSQHRSFWFVFWISRSYFLTLSALHSLSKSWIPSMFWMLERKGGEGGPLIWSPDRPPTSPCWPSCLSAVRYLARSRCSFNRFSRLALSGRDCGGEVSL